MSRLVEIGTLRERIEVIEEPVAGANGRIGRIRHANGENAPIDAQTLDWLIHRAQQPPHARRPTCLHKPGVLWA